jgi:hypothetical protein
MSSNSCIQLEDYIYTIAMTTIDTVNFTSLQFSLSVNSLVIFLFSNYPFNLGYANYFCVNPDEFGFAQVGQNFNIDLSNYQNYYMLILIIPQGISLCNYTGCDIISNFTITFQNTTISKIESETVIANCGSERKTGFCSGCNTQCQAIGTTCSNSNYVPAISLNSLNNQLITLTCQAFIYENNTTVGFVTPFRCYNFGAYLTASIHFIANQQVIDFLNSNGIPYNNISPSFCQTNSTSSTSTSTSTTTSLFPCRSIYEFGKLLTPPSKYSIISSQMWNDIRNDLFLAYSIYKYINNYINGLNFENIKSYFDYIYKSIDIVEPYHFSNIIQASYGLPLKYSDINNLILAIQKLSYKNSIDLIKKIEPVTQGQVVKTETFKQIIDNVNYIITFANNNYFMFDCYGEKFASLNQPFTILNVFIPYFTKSVSLYGTSYVKNLFILQLQQSISLNNNSSINYMVLQNNEGGIYLYDYSYIRNLEIQNNNNELYLSGNSYIDVTYIANNNNVIISEENSKIKNLIFNVNNGTIEIENGSTIYTFLIEQNYGELYVENYVKVENLDFDLNEGDIYVGYDSYVENLQIVNNKGNIYIYAGATVNFLQCTNNSGNVYIEEGGKVINNQCYTS